MLVYFLIRTLFNLYPSYESAASVGKTYLANTLSIFAGSEYWFVFTLFGYLLVAPFLARMIEHMTRTESLAFLGIGIAYNFIVIISMNTGIEFEWGYLFSGFAFTFCIGALLDKISFSEKAIKRWYVAAIASFIIGVALREAGWGAGSMDVSPFYTILAIGIYLFILRTGEKIRKSRVIPFMARHSFGVFLTHMMVLWPILWNLPSIEGPITIPLHIALTAAAAAASLLIAALIDTALVKPVQLAFDRFVRLARSDKMEPGSHSESPGKDGGDGRLSTSS